MADRVVKVLENNRLVTRGVGVDGRKAVINIDENETLPFTINWSAWLGTDTISSVSNVASGPTLTSESNTTTSALFSVAASSDGTIEQRITTAAGAIKELTIIVNAGGSTKTYPSFC